MIKKINSNTLMLIMLLSLWLFPLFQGSFKVLKFEELGGVSATVSDTILDMDTWFSGRYAEKKQNYLTNSFGLREIAIKIQNQIQYSLFDKTNADDVVLGKDNYLYEMKYITSFYGVDHIDKKYFEEKVIKLKFVQDTLAKLNKTIIFLFAPSKATFFSEFLPTTYTNDKIVTNYSEVKPLIVKYKINHIDYNAMFKRMKLSSPYALYPVAGTHWSEYGNILALDSLCHYINTHTSFKLPEFNYSKINITNGYGGTDNDMGKAINLLFPPDYGKLAYPEVIITEKKDDKKPNVLMVSDSYWSSIYHSNRPKQLFNKHTFWFYYNTSSDYNNETEGKMPLDLNLQNELTKNDIICIMCTEPNLKVLGYRFIDDCYDLFKNGKLDEVERKRNFEIDQKRLTFWNDNIFVKKLEKMAKKQGVSIDSMITDIAKSLVDTPH